MFSMKSVISKERFEKNPVIIQCWDISKFFDKEQIEDALLTCYKREANPKAVRLWAKLNENTKIKVKTSVGECESEEVGAVVGQGTIGGALVRGAFKSNFWKNLGLWPNWGGGGLRIPNFYPIFPEQPLL